MKILIDDFVPSDLTDAQKKTAVCEWFVREPLKFAECFIRAELNHVPHNMKITIEKPIAFKDELVDFADIVIDYETPSKLNKKDELKNKSLSLLKLIKLNEMLEESVKKSHSETMESHHKLQTQSLFSVGYTAPYLLENELEKIGETKKRIEDEYQKVKAKSVDNLKGTKDSKLNKERLLISVIPTLGTLKEDINGAIRDMKTVDFYLPDVTQKFIVYWGRTDDDIRNYIKYENIQLTGLYETLYHVDITDDDIPF